MTLIFYKDEEEELLQLESESNPFSIGDKVWINVTNRTPEIWDISPERCFFLIEKIEKQISKSYSGNSVIEHLDISFYGKISVE